MSARLPVVTALALIALACPGPEPGPAQPDATPALRDAGLADGALRFDARVGDLGPQDAGGEVALDDIDPRSGVISGGYRVRLSGEGFTTDMQVRFGERLADNLLLQSSRSVTVRVPAGAAAGPVDVTVDNGAYQAVLPAGFVYFDALEIAALQPDTVLTTGGTPVAVAGAGFVGELLVLVGGRAAAGVEIQGEQQLRLIAPPGAPGRVHVEILSTYGRAEAPLALRYVAPLGLARTEPAATAQAGGATIVLHGEGFGPDTALRVGGQPVPAEVIDGARLRFTAPASAVVGAVDVEVVDPWSRARLEGGLAYLPAPSSSLRLDAVVPAAGDAFGGDERWLFGAGFDQGPLSITFDGVAAALLDVDGPTALRVRTPAHAAGAVDVRVAGRSQSATLPGGYTYRDRVALDAVLPGTGPAAGGTVIRVQGRGFTDDTRLWIGGQPALEVVRVDDATLDARTPPGSAGAVAVEVEDPARGSARLDGGFTYEAALALTAVRPVRGGMAGGTYVRVYGRGFAAGEPPLLRFASSPATAVEVLADNLLVARTPPHAPGVVDVSVGRGPELVTVARAFTFYDPGSLVGGTRGGTLDGAMYVSCFHAMTGLPLDGITVMLGTAPGTTYLALTDAYGQATLSGPDLHGPQTLSAAAAGYESITLVEVNAAEVSLFLYPTTMTPSSGQPPPLPPPPVISGRVYGFAKELFDPAALGPGESALAVVETTMRSIFSSPAAIQSTQYVVQNGGTYTIPAARPGRLAVVAVAGIYNLGTQAFRPRQIGFARGVQAGYGDVLENVDVELTVPLNTELEVTLPAMPYGEPDPESGLVMPFVNLGGEGVYPLPKQQVGAQTQLTFADFPDLPGEMLTFLAGAFVLDPSRPCQYDGSCPYSVVVRDGVGDLSAGIALDPILGFPELIEPPPNGVMTGNRLRWKPAPGTLPSYYEVYLMGLDGTAWDFYVPGTLSKLVVPTFPALDVENPPGNTGLGAYQAWMIAVYVPGFAFDNFSYLELSGTARRAWTQATFKFVNANTP